MPSIGDTTRPAFAYDQATDTWVPVGVGPHSHTPAAIGAISNSLTTTTGDLIYAASANTPARLGIGSTGQVLSVSGGVPAWATISTSPTFVGCRAYQSGDTTIPVSTDVIMGFNNENFDTNGFHDNATNNSRMTIPSGYAGKYAVWANLAYSGSSGTNRVVQILKNGSVVAETYSPSSTSNAMTVFINLNMDLAVGDYLQVRTNSQGASSSLTVFGSSSLSPNQAATVFQITYLGA